MFTSKAQSSLTSFALLLLVFLVLFSSIVLYTSSEKETVLELKKNQELTLLLLDLRGELIELISLSNLSNLTYETSYVDSSIEVSLNDSGIFAEYSDEVKVSVQVASLSLEFCSNYSFYPVSPQTFSYNGSCILLT